MRSLFLAILTGLVGAAVLHIVIVLALPQFAQNDAWTRVRSSASPEVFVPLHAVGGAEASANAAAVQPFTRAAVCRFDIAEGPIWLTAAGDVPFWSIGVFDRRSNEIFSMNDRTATGGVLDVAIVPPLQLVELRANLPPRLAASVLIEMPAPEGYVILRTVIPDETMSAAAEAFLASARCERLPPE